MAIKVAIRGRPLLPSEQQEDRSVHCAEYCSDNKTVVIADEKVFTLDHCFHEDVSQEDVYVQFISPLVDKFLGGENCSVLAYGQTGSGKTYTMGSDYAGTFTEISESTGIIPRFLEHLFESMKKEPDPITLKMSFLEVLNDSVFDILSHAKHNLAVQDVGNTIRISNLSEVDVDNLQDSLLQFSKAMKARTHAFTELNANSSRSHAFCIIKMHRLTENSVIESKLQLVDLAGSENSRRANTKGERFMEGININKSLLCLGQVITALCTKNSHVPYRNHVLTRILRDTLNGNANTRMIACINPHINCLNETVDTLRYASSARCIPPRNIARPGKENRFVKQLSLVPPTPLKAYPMTPSASQAANLSSISLGLPVMSSTVARQPPPKFDIHSDDHAFLSPLSDKIKSYVDKRLSETLEQTLDRRRTKRPTYAGSEFDTFWSTTYKSPVAESAFDPESATALDSILSPIAKKLNNMIEQSMSKSPITKKLNYLIEQSISQRIGELKTMKPDRPKRRSVLSDVSNLSPSVDVAFMNKTANKPKSPFRTALEKQDVSLTPTPSVNVSFTDKTPNKLKSPFQISSEKPDAGLQSAEKPRRTILTRRRTMMSLSSQNPAITGTVTTRRRSVMCFNVDEPPTMARNKQTKRLSTLQESPGSGDFSIPAPSKKRRQIPPTEDTLCTTNLTESPEDFIFKKPKPSKRSKRRLTTINVVDLQKKNSEVILKRLNEGSVKDLQVLPAIGPKSAFMIHTYRTMYGGFQSVEDLKKVGLANNLFHSFMKKNFLMLP